MVGRMHMKASQRFDCSLFLCVMGLLVGSTVWLRLIPSGDLSGRGILMPLWRMPSGMGRDSDGRPLPSIVGLNMQVQQAECNYTSAIDPESCGVDNPQISVSATIDDHANVTRGVTLAIYSSNDFEFWRQANSVELPRDLFRTGDTTIAEAGQRLISSGPMAVSTSVCFGEPGAYYVVACAREGIPPGGSALPGLRPTCTFPPCANSVGPPFSQCLAIATACVSTCETGAVEVIPKRQFVSGQGARCVNGTIPRNLIEASAIEGNGVSGAFLAFLVCYTIGIIYFMIMYLPGIGATDATSPSWDLFLGAILSEGHVVVKTSASRNEVIRPELLVATRTEEADRHRQEEAEAARETTRRKDAEHELTSKLVMGRVKAAAKFHKQDELGPSPSFKPGEGLHLDTSSTSAAADNIELARLSQIRESLPDPASSTSADAPPPPPESPPSQFTLKLPEVGKAKNRYRRPTIANTSAINLLSLEIDHGKASDSHHAPPPPDPEHMIQNPLFGLKTFEEAELEMHQTAELETDELLTARRHTHFELDDDAAAPSVMSAFKLNATNLTATTPEMSQHPTVRQRAKMLKREKMQPLVGVTPVMFSISASEGPNILLRNFLGKIATNLALGLDVKRLKTWQLIDGFADEGHRIGAYYLFRATSIAFYESMNPSIALRVVSSWLEAINGHDHANNVDKFDKEKQTDLFALLPAVDQVRPQVIYVKFFHKLFRSLNAFTVDVDELFDRALHQPFVSPSVYKTAYAYVQAMGAGALNEKDLMDATGITSIDVARVLLISCQIDAGGSADPYHATLANLISEDLVKGQAEPAPPEARRPTLATETKPPSLSNGLSSPRNPRKICFALDSQEVEAFFSPEFISTFGHLLGCEYKDTLADGEPIHFGAYIACLQKLDAKEPLRCTAFTKLAPTLSHLELTRMLDATNRRWLAYDHVKIVAGRKGRCKAMYCARGRPDAWKPETKRDHRRVLMPGCWACRVPEDDSDEEFWASRREIALIHGVATHHVVAHCYTDLQLGDTDAPSAQVNEGVARKRVEKLRVLNTHLGKAGGLNFGIEAILRMDIVHKPSQAHPMIFAIVDARHSSDSRWWQHILPSFFEVHSIEDRVMFNPDVVLCQVHSDAAT